MSWQQFKDSRISRVVFPILIVLFVMLPFGILYLSGQRLNQEQELPIDQPDPEEVMPGQPARPGSHDL